MRDISIWVYTSEDRPILSTRLVDDSGGISTGGDAQVGRVGVNCATRSVTNCRDSSWLTPRSKIRVIDDRSATDFDRSSWTPAIPASCSSIGVVISSSTSVEELPMAIVWISTRGGANSGKTSTDALRRSRKPRTITVAAANSTSQRNFRLEATIVRIISDQLPTQRPTPGWRPP